jgi:steroid 5-alpha reductase family enzyme
MAVVVGWYLVAGLAGSAVWRLAGPAHPVAAAFWADLAATAVVFAGSTVLANASLYDPYWSVAPPLIVAGWIVAGGGGVGARQAVVLALVTVWATRLTANWAIGWAGLDHEDWRYRSLRERTRGRLPWWLVNLGGIQLMPTLVVFAGLLSAWPAVVGDRPVGPLDGLAALVTSVAIALEAVADRQRRRFARDPANHGRVLDRGVWRFSRHPNYLGEIGFWWGLWLFGLAAAPHWWWTVGGPLAMVALFAGVSIPMMDRRSLARRPGYAAHMARVPALLPLPRPRRGRAPGAST